MRLLWTQQRGLEGSSWGQMVGRGQHDMEPRTRLLASNCAGCGWQWTCLCASVCLSFLHQYRGDTAIPDGPVSIGCPNAFRLLRTAPGTQYVLTMTREGRPRRRAWDAGPYALASSERRCPPLVFRSFFLWLPPISNSVSEGHLAGHTVFHLLPRACPWYWPALN